MKRRRRRRTAKLLLLAILGGVTACGDSTGLEAAQDDTSTTVASSAAEDVQYVFDLLSGRQYHGLPLRSPGHLYDYLPNTHGVRVDSPSPPSELHPDTAIVVGEIVEVRPCRAIIELPEQGPGERDEDRQREVAWDDPSAWARSWELTIRVDEMLGDLPDGATLTSGVTMGAGIDLQRWERGLLNIGPALFVVSDDNGLFFPDRNDVWRLHYGGILVAPIGEGGTLRWPMVIAPNEAATLLSGAATLEELRARAAEPVRYVEIYGSGEQWRYVSEQPTPPTTTAVPSGG